MEKNIRKPRLEKNIGRGRKQDQIVLGIIGLIAAIALVFVIVLMVKEARKIKYNPIDTSKVMEIENDIESIGNAQVEEEIEKRINEAVSETENQEVKREELENTIREDVKRELEDKKADHWNPVVEENFKTAIKIVKDEVKNNKYAYDVIDVLLDQRVVVVVKNPDTTEVYAYYIVNTENNTFEVKN